LGDLYFLKTGSAQN